jgi:26S proteasome regulatory subunit T5
VAHLTTEDIVQRIKIMEGNMRAFKVESTRLQHELVKVNTSLKDNQSKIKQNKQLPWLVSNIVEILDLEPEQPDEGVIDVEEQIEGKAVVIKTSTRNTVFLPVPGLVEPSELKPGELVGVNKDSYILLEKLPAEYDSRVKSMEVDEKPTEEYGDIGGLNKQIEELREAIVLPITHKDKFKSIGIRPPKGCLMFGPPGTGKTMMARACAAQTKATFLKLAGPHLVQMYIGDGAKMVRDAFALAKEKSPTIIFIDEIDAVGTKRFDNDKSGDREVQRTMLELLNQLDGYTFL